VSYTSKKLLDTIPDYLLMLEKEIDMTFDEIKRMGLHVKTVYIGGGTPSQLSAGNLRKLFHNINKVYLQPNGQTGFENVREITIECNPDDVTDEFVSTLSQLPVNRISMGAQTFSDERLRFLHRRHNAHQVVEAVGRLRKAGFRNISIDLMFGFPGETLDDWQRDIDEALALHVEHISAYSLMVEEGTPLYRMMNQTSQSTHLRPLEEETERKMYEMLIERLTAAGYEHYEISNFAKPSYRSLHNSNYWNGTPYYGIGAAAHSYGTFLPSSPKNEGKLYRYWNVSDIHQYIQAIEQGIIPFEFEELNADTRYNDLITTALRTKEGIFLPSLEPRYHKYLMENAKTAINNGLLQIDDNHIHLTRQGLFVSDDVMSDLVFV
jgi:oxygen-independent coproporphyrinogen-3 oxidase